MPHASCLKITHFSAGAAPESRHSFAESSASEFLAAAAGLSAGAGLTLGWARLGLGVRPASVAVVGIHVLKGCWTEALSTWAPGPFQRGCSLL